MWLSWWPVQVNSVRRPSLGAFVELLVIGDVLVAAHASGDIVAYSISDLKGGATAEEAERSRIPLDLPARVSPVALAHPPTYLNKVVVGDSSGCFSVVNLRSRKVLYRSRSLGSPIACLEPAPAVDVLAIGLDDGRVVVHNIRADRTVVTFRHAEADADLLGGGVTALSFCTDPLREPALLSTSARGAMALWDLTAKRLSWAQPGTHAGAVEGAFFLPRQPAFITAGQDNAVKQWLLDRLDSLPRVLRQREGHTAPPTVVRYFRGDALATMASGADASVCEVLSAGPDRTLRMFHTALERQNRELSQGERLKGRGLRVGLVQHVCISLSSDRPFAQVTWSARLGRRELLLIRCGCRPSRHSPPPTAGPGSGPMLSRRTKGGARRTCGTSTARRLNPWSFNSPDRPRRSSPPWRSPRAGVLPSSGARAGPWRSSTCRTAPRGAASLPAGESSEGRP